MKKIMTIIAMGVLCLCVTSCSDICEEAYTAEQMYKYYKDLNGGYAAAMQYKQEFLNLYQSMTDSQQRRYKVYRERMNTEARELRSIEENTKAEALKMLEE